MKTIVDLVLRMAFENRSWGYAHPWRIGPGTQHGIKPAPERDRHIRWSTFLKAHWECLTATDFLSVEVHTFKGLVTYYILFFSDIASRSVHIAGITPQHASARAFESANHRQGGMASQGLAAEVPRLPAAQHDQTSRHSFCVPAIGVTREARNGSPYSSPRRPDHAVRSRDWSP